MKCMRCNVEMIETGVKGNEEVNVITMIKSGSLVSADKSEFMMTESVDVFTDFSGGGGITKYGITYSGSRKCADIGYRICPNCGMVEKRIASEDLKRLFG